MTISIGDEAPHFSLPDQNGDPRTLEEFVDDKTLVVFIPFPFSGICDAEGCMIRDRLSDLDDLGAEVVVITCDTRFTNRKWAKDQGFTFPVLSDYWPHGETTRAYGAFNEAIGAAHRTTFVLDDEGIVRDVIATESMGIAREFPAYVTALEAL